MHHIHGCTGMGKERIYKYINNKLAETEFRLIYSKIRENEIFNGYIGLYHSLRDNITPGLTS